MQEAYDFTHQSKQTLLNREYSCTMRNQHYEKAFYIYHKLESLVKSKPEISLKDQVSLLLEFNAELKSCLDFAKLAVFHHKRNRIAHFKTDKTYGILQEEIILVHLLEEIQSCITFLLNRVETDESMSEFANVLESHKSNHETDGFVNSVLTYFKETKKTGYEDFSQIYSLIRERYNIGNKLFALISELQVF
jgi:hypothetical protein